MPNLKGVWKYFKTYAYTITNKVSMKALKRFTQMEIKEHDCYLANWAWLEGRDNQYNLATWHEMFLEKSIPQLEFCRKNQVWMDVIQCCMMIGWTYLESSSFIFFASNLEWLVIKISEEIFSQIYLYAHFTRAS